MKIKYRKDENLTNDCLEEVYVNGQYVGDLFLYQEEGQCHTFFPEGGQPVERWDISEKEMKAEVEELLAQFFGDDETEAEDEVEGEEKRMEMNLQYFAEKGVKMFSNGLVDLPVKEVDGQVMFDAEQSAIGLGISFVAKSGNEVVRWSRVNEYIGVSTNRHKVKKGDFITEPQFYKLAIKANNSVAEKFQDWVTTEVLPSIRKHGAYMTDVKAFDVVNNQSGLADLLQQAADQLKAKDVKIERLQTVNNVLADENQRMKPKARFAEAVETTKTSILVGELAKILKQNGVDTLMIDGKEYAMGPNNLFKWMRANGYLISRKGTDYNMPTQKSMRMHLFEIKESTRTAPDGHVNIMKTPKVTGKGQVYFVNKFVAWKEVS